MAPSFPIPVLAVTADAVRDLDGHEALSGLWTLFTKCKESLQDGRRLENISWRLWYRELMLADRPPLNNSTHYSLEGELLDEKLSYSHPSSSFSSAASTSSSSSYSPSHSPALSHTSSAYRPPTPAESLNADNSLAYAVHDPQVQQGETASSLSSQRLNLTDLPPSSSSSPTVPSIPSQNTATYPEPYSALPSPLPSPSIAQSIPQSIPPSTALSIPHPSGSTEDPALTYSLSSLSPSHPPAPSISHSQSQATYVPPSAHPPHPASSSYSPSLAHPRSRPAIARSHTESSVIGVVDASRTRRSSFAGMSVGRIICDMLPNRGAEACSSGGKSKGGCGRVAADAEARRERREAGADQAGSLKVAPGMQMTPLAAAAAATAAISYLPTPETEEGESNSRIRMSAAPREEPREAPREAREAPLLHREGGAEPASVDRLPEEGGGVARGVASSAFAAHVAHVAGAAASEVAHALALAPGEAGGGPARQRGTVGPAAAEAEGVISGAGRGAADRGAGSDRRGDKDKDRDSAAFAPRGLDTGGAYPVSGERAGFAGAEDDRDTYSGTSTPTHTHTPPQIFQPLQESPQPPRLIVVNPTPNLTPHPTPPSTPIAFAGLPRAFIPGPHQFLMPPGHQARAHGQGQGSSNPSMQQYHLQQAQLAQLLPPLTLPPPPQAGLRTHVPDGASYVTGGGSSNLQAGHVHVSSDRAEKSPASASAAGAGASTRPGVYPGAAHAARGQRHEDAQMHSHSQHAHSSHSTQYFQQQQQHSQSPYSQYGHHSQVLPDGYGYAHAHSAHSRAVDADAELVVPAQTALLLEGARTGADHFEGVHLLGLLPPLSLSGNGYNATSSSQTPSPAPAANTTSGIGNVNGSRDNVNRRSISSNTSASSQTTTASLQSTRSRATDSSSATSASARSKTTTSEGFETVVGEEYSEAIFGGHFAMGEVQINKGTLVMMHTGMDSAGGKQNQVLDGADDNDEALDEEEDDPLSPLPTVTSFAGSISPRTDERTNRNSKRHSLPPRSTSDSAQMRIALSLSPASRVRLGDVDAPPAVAEERSQKDPGNTSQAPARTVIRSRSASSTRSVGKRSSVSASSKASRKTAVAPAPLPQPATTAATSSTASASTLTKTTATTKATGGTAMRRSSSTRSTSRTRSVAGSSLGKSRSRSREPGLGLGLGLGMTTATAQAAAALVAAVVPSAATRTTKPAVRGKAKFSLGRAGNKKSAALVALRRNSSGMVGKGKAKQREEEEEEEEDDDDEEDGEVGGRNAGDDDDNDEMVDLGELNREVAERERRETEEKERERMYLQEQARRAAFAEEEKERRRQAERHQRQLDTIAALTGPVTADNVSETSSKRPVRFNIGSNSDDGMGGKSAGSGSEVSGGVSGQSVGADTAVVGGKGKEREMSLQQRLAIQQQEYHYLLPQQQQYQQQQHHVKRSTGQYVHGNRQLSKPELHQLQIMEQMRLQQQRPTAAQQQALQYQQQFQTHLQQPQPSLPQQAVATIESSTTSKKGKQRETVVAPLVESLTKPKKGNSRTRDGPGGVGVVDPVLAAQIQDSLNTPLLPTGKKRVELVSTESEFETTDDEGDEDDGEWSSAEMTADDEEVRQTQEEQEQNRLLLLQIQQQHDRQMQLLQQQERELRQQAARPQVPQRTHSSHYPAPNNARGKHQTRAQIQRQAQAQAQAQALVDQAVIEAQRQREMFVKLPTSSFQDLAKARTNSVGLLTQLMNPDLEKFPPNHPYRRGFSSGELRRSGISALAPMQPMTPVVAPNSGQPSPAPTPTANADQLPAVSAVIVPQPMQSTTSAPAPSDPPTAPPSTSRPVVTRRNTADVIPNRAAFSPPLRSGGLVLTKSSAALPAATQLQVGSVATKQAHRTSALLERVNLNGSGGSGGYRPRGPPKGQEMEEDSDSDDGVIQISKSVAQEKLKALAERQAIKPAAKKLDPNAPGPSNPKAAAAATDDNDVPQWVVAQPQVQHHRSQSQGEPVQRRVPAGLQLTRAEGEEAPPPPATAPIKVDYPYNLPLPIPPSTPRTTRRNMLATELTESLRRNVLWHRHVDKPNPAIRRATSSGGGRNNVLGGVRPLTAAPSMVQLHAKGTKPEGTSQITRHEPLTDREREEARQRRLTKNKSWANDYHYSGW